MIASSHIHQAEPAQGHILWLMLRVILLVNAFVLMLLAPADSVTNSLPAAWFATLEFIIAALFVLLISAIEAWADTYSGRKDLWRRPSLRINPFAKRKPLQFWFFCALLILSLGGGLCAGSLAKGTFQIEMTQFVAVPMGLLVGIGLSLLIWQRRFEPRAPRSVN